MNIKDLLQETVSNREDSSAWRKACGKLLWELGNGGYSKIFDLELLRGCLQVADKFERDDIIKGLKNHLKEVEQLFEKIETFTQPGDVVESVLSSRLIAADLRLAQNLLEIFWADHNVYGKDKEAITNLLQLRKAGVGVKGLFYSAGKGVVRKVYLHVSFNGSGIITCGNRAGEDLERAGRNAVAAALRYLEEEVTDEEAMCDVHWQVEGVGDEFEGSSVGLAVAVGVIDGYLKHIGITSSPREVLSDGAISNFAFTGEVEVDGRIAKVGGIAAKARAAESEGIGYMVFPSGSSEQIPEGLLRSKFIPSGHLREVVKAIWGDIGRKVALERRTIFSLTPRRRLVLIGALLTTVAILALVWELEAFSWGEVGLEGVLLRARSWIENDRSLGANGRAPLDLPVAIVSIDNVSMKELGEYGLSWRGHHSRLVDVLAIEGARAIGFDVCFEETSKWDEEFADSLRRAKTNGVAVVLGVGCSIENGKPILPTETIRAAASGLGNVYLGQVLGVVRKAQVAIPQAGVQGVKEPSDQPLQALELPTVPSFDLQLLVGGGVEDTRLNLKERKIYSSSIQPIPVDGEGYIHIDFAQGEFRRISYVDVLSGTFTPNFFRRKVVLVGAEFRVHGKELDNYLTPRGRMYGVEIHAHTMSTILGGRYIRSLDRWPLRALWVGLWISSMALLSLRFIRWRFAILALGFIIFVLISFYLFLSFDLLLGITYPLVGMGLTSWWTGRIING